MKINVQNKNKRSIIPNAHWIVSSHKSIKSIINNKIILITIKIKLTHFWDITKKGI